MVKQNYLLISIYFFVFFSDVEPPVVDYCESPPEFITDTEDVEIDWDEPIFHDNSRYDHEQRD